MRILNAAALAMLPGACVGAGDRAHVATHRDSAGIGITVNPASAVELAGRWYMDETPTLVIGESEGEPVYQLFQVRGATRLTDGRIAVLNSGSHEIRFFTGAGEYTGSVGQNGEGPGEFRSPQSLFRIAGDSLLVWDRALRRINVFDGAGNPARTVSPEIAGANPFLLGMFDGGEAVIINHELRVPDSGFEMTYARLLRYSSTGGRADSLNVIPWMEIGVVGDPANRQLSGPIFSPRTSVALHRDRLWVGTGAEPSVHVHDRSGALISIVRWFAGEDRRVRPGDAARHNDTRFAGMPANIRHGFDELPVAERYPAYADIAVDALGNLWVERYPRPAEDGPDRWLVFGEDGVLRARVDTPRDLQIFEIGPNWVLGVLRDDLGVERVAVFGLYRSG